MTPRILLSLACFGAAGAWPTLVSMIETALMSPLERATREAICGLPFHQSGFELLGHCASCWAGAAILVATGIVVLTSNPARSAPAHAHG